VPCVSVTCLLCCVHGVVVVADWRKTAFSRIQWQEARRRAVPRTVARPGGRLSKGTLGAAGSFDRFSRMVVLMRSSSTREFAFFMLLTVIRSLLVSM